MIRNAVLALIALTVGAAAAQAQVQVINRNWAEKLFPEGISHDFGTVPRGTELYYRFPIKNIYAVRLEIMSVRVSCGCVTATASTQVLEPRETAYLDITMDGRRFTGPKNVSVFFTVGPQFISTATLQVTANSRADVVFNPGEINFGVVPRGQTPTQVVDIEYAGVLDWRIPEVTPGSAPLDVALEELYRRPGQVGYRVKTTLKPDAPPGAGRWEVVLKTNDPATPNLALLVEGTVQAALTVVPSTVSMGNLKVGETVTRKVVVRGNKPFRIMAIDGLGDGVQADLPATPAQVQIVTLKYQPPKAGDLHRQLEIKTDFGEGSGAGVTIEGSVAP